MKTVGEARLWLKENLKDLFSAEELPEIVFLMLNQITGFTSTQIHIFPEKELTETQTRMLLLSAKKLQTGMPVQYALGEAGFLGLKFSVNESVLIPRPETEELVSWVLEERAKGERLKGESLADAWPIADSRKLTADSRKPIADTSQLTAILDIGTGSGCIPIAIKKNWPEATVSGLDISAEALETAKHNALINQVDVHFFQQDVLNFYPVKEASAYNIIVSNPPYITPEEKLRMHRNVLDFEPYQALFVPQNDPLLFYRAIAGHAAFMLQKKGLLFLEINENYGPETVTLLQQSGFENIVLRQDFYGKNRMIRAQKP